jgi:hypothetical protein
MVEKILPAGVTILDINLATGKVPGLQLKIADLDKAKRGDWIRLVLAFPGKDGPQTEFLTCMIASKGANGLIRCRVLSTPENSSVHTVKYGDDLTVSERYIVEHSLATSSEVETTAYLLEDAKPIVPTPGRPYWTRDGATAIVWTTLSDDKGPFFLGEISWPGGIGRQGQRDVQWAMDGRHRGGDSGLDIVKDPTA